MKKINTNKLTVLLFFILGLFMVFKISTENIFQKAEYKQDPYQKYYKTKKRYLEIKMQLSTIKKLEQARQNEKKN